MLSIKAYILSVKESDRRPNAENLKTKLESIGIPTEIIDAYYFLETDVVTKLYEDGCYYDSPNKTISQSQIGCFLSHREAWKRIATDPEQSTKTFIIEDDMVLDDSKNQKDLLDLLKESNMGSLAGEDCDSKFESLIWSKIREPTVPPIRINSGV